MFSIALWAAAALSITSIVPATSTDDKPRRPIVEQEIVPGKLRVKVFAGTVPGKDGPLPVWTYATDGLRASGQKEFLLTILRRTDERPDQYPTDPFDIFAALYPLAAGGKLGGEGGHARFAGAPFLGRTDVAGILYTRPDPLRSASAQAEGLLLVPLTEAELQVASKLGHLRMLGILGAHYGLYPWPVFFDRARPSLVPGPEEWHSVLSLMILVRIPGVRVAASMAGSGAQWVGGGNLEVSLPRARQDEIAEALLENGDSSVALFAELDPAANGLAIFRPGQNGPTAIKAGRNSVSRVSGNFVSFLSGAALSDSARLYEDGFAVMLTSDSRRALADALRTGHDLDRPGKGGMSFSLRWRE
jgi:Smad anchor for receptor activation-like, C-terminal